MNEVWFSIASIFTAIVGVAMLAVLVSRRSDTANIIRAGGAAFSSGLAVAVSPVTGGSFSPSFNGNQLFNGSIVI